VLFSIFADTDTRKQISIFRDETRSVASAQKDEEMQQKQGYYEPFTDFHATKIQHLIHNSQLIIHNSRKKP
jgi:hypothetical protein